MDYGEGIKGSNFKVKRLVDFDNITHVEQTLPPWARQLKKSTTKILVFRNLVYQKNFWSNKTETSQLENLNPNAPLPESRDNILGLVDNFDVPYGKLYY